MRALAVVLLVVACSKAEPAKAREATAAQRTWLGVTVGVTPIAAARFAIEARGLTCEDASLAAVMRKAHGQAGVPAGPDGGPPPAAEMPSGHGRYLDDPALAQARIACAGLPLDELGDGRAPGRTGRVLLVAPEPDAAVSLIAIQRTHTDAAAAADDARAMFDALARYGATTEAKGDVPAAGATLPALTPVRRVWKLGGVTVEARAVDLGQTGISISEELRFP